MEKSVSGGPLCPRLAHRKHTHTGTHTLTHTHCHMLSALSSVYITYEFWHAALDGWQKAQSFVCRQLFHTSHTWPQQACLEAQASKTTHTRTHAPLWGFFHMNFLFSLLVLYGFNSLAQTHLNSPELQLKSFLLCKSQWYLYFQLFATFSGFYLLFKRYCVCNIYSLNFADKNLVTIQRGS